MHTLRREFDAKKALYDLARCSRWAAVRFLDSLVRYPGEPHRRDGFPFLSFFLASKGFSGNVAALAVSCWGIGGLTATFFGGWSADRIGRKPTLLAGLLLSALAMLAMPWGNSVLRIDLCAFMAGFAFDFQRPAVFATVADLVPVSDRVRAFGLTYWAINIGASLAPLIGGVLAAISFVFLFTFDAVSSLGYFVLIFFRLREPAQHLASTGQPHSPFAGFSDRRMLLLFLLSSFLTSQFFQAYSTLPLVMRLHGMNAGDYSRAIMTNGCLVAIAFWLFFDRIRIEDAERNQELESRS
jgi:MFS family permease